jgi:hypothetical protein
LSALAHVQAVREGLPDSHEFDERDLALLSLAEGQARDVDALDAALREAEIVVDGKVSPLVTQARNARLALAKLLGQVDMPEAGRQSQVHARKAATARWGTKAA